MLRIALFVLAAVLCNAVAMPASANVLEIRIEQVLPAGLIVVSVHNAGKAPLKVWRDGNEWGTARWRILHESGDGRLHTYFQDPDRIFTVNMRAFHEVPVEKPLQVKLDVNDGQWLPRGERTTFQPGDSVTVVYDVPLTEDAEEMGVWWGVVSAKTVVR